MIAVEELAPKAGVLEAEVLQSLFPRDCAVAVRTEPGRVSDLFDSEVECIRDAVPERQHEFAAGRACVRQAFRSVGAPPYAILPDKFRAPVWPHGLIGSISHCPGLCVAVIAHRLMGKAVGVDVEINDRLKDGLRDLVAVPDERHALDNLQRALPCDPLKLLFVIKEAVFKLYFPATRHFLDFHHARVRLDPETGAFEAELVDSSAPAAFGLRRFSGRFGATGSYLMAGGVI